jgi:hypothetical protein
MNPGLSNSLAGFITMAIAEARMNDVKNGQAICKNTGRSNHQYDDIPAAPRTGCVTV